MFKSAVILGSFTLAIISCAHKTYSADTTGNTVYATTTFVVADNNTLQSYCPAEMVRVKGKYCTAVKQECEVWLDKDNASIRRCQKYKPSECVGKRVDKDFCIDKYEYADNGETLPKVNVDWYEAKSICEKQNKQLCNDDDWEFACEGEDMLPHTTGLERPSDKCNIDIVKGLGKVGHLIDHRVAVDAMPECVSPFGAVNMNGNVDEITQRHSTTYARYNSVLKGGWWTAIRARCRPVTIGHSELYGDAQLGFRCCKGIQ